MRRSNLTTLLYLGLVFVSGAVVGGFADHLLTPVIAAPKVQKSRAEMRNQYLQEMRSRLNLNESQITALQQIMDTTGQRFEAWHKSVDVEHRQIENEHRQKVVAILNDNQKAEYAKMIEERERHRQEQAKKGL